MNNNDKLKRLSTKVRRQILEMIYNSKASHIGSSMSMVELLVVLYNEVLNVDKNEPDKEDRDRFILSKGHGSAAYYAILAEKGFFPYEWLDTFYKNGSNLAGHSTSKNIPGIEVSTGSLGHGLSIATGMAMAAKMDNKNYKVFCMLSDGECDEGSTWEAILFASHHKLSNLTAIIDYNKMQALGTTEEVLNLEPFAQKWKAFGWSTREINGHDIQEIVETLSEIPFEIDKPNCVIAHTVKGKGVSFMENELLWHYRCPDENEYKKATKELEVD